MTNNQSIAGYIRVSDQKLKTDGDRRQDINRQQQKIISYCKTMELGTPIFFSDDGLSAFKDDYNSRPEFLRMLREVKANRVKHIIIEDITRWSRRIGDGLKTLSEVTNAAQWHCERYNKNAVIIEEKRDERSYRNQVNFFCM